MLGTLPHQPLQSLSQEQQIELMANLEKTGLSDVENEGHTMPDYSVLYERRRPCKSGYGLVRGR